MSPDEQLFLEREIKRSNRWGRKTFGQIMETLDRQYEALEAISEDSSTPEYIRTLAKEAKR